ncbi:hypothetical protein ACYFX5_06520 [Bremerella sp. T1]|uniref:hypothetical protein n=1 Tax=Bremerella sp. TYQ1 TaxID=3119568 RepID=UPI001CCFD8CA|nr:hypothetical protein [Bremerella volcania]UBM37912.1 hypothetical protein LA756_08465 [Bremerella volcania]
MVDFTDRDDDYVEVVADRPMRPKKITVIAVIAIIFGGLYVLGFLGSIPGLVIQLVAPDAFNFAPPGDDPSAKMQIEMQEKMGEVTRKYILPMFLLSITSLVAGVLLLYSSIQVLRRDELGDYRLFRNTTTFCLALVIANTIFTTLLQMANMKAIDAAFSAENFSGSNPRQAQVFQTVMYYSMLLGVVMGIMFQLLKLAYFGIANWILSHYLKTRTAT